MTTNQQNLTTNQLTQQGNDNYTELQVLLPSFEEAKELAAKFPKSVKAKAFKLSLWNLASEANGWKPPALGGVRVLANWTKLGEGNEANEAGAKRLARALQVFEANGFTL